MDGLDEDQRRIVVPTYCCRRVGVNWRIGSVNVPDEDKARQGREPFDVGEWLGAGLLFCVVWFFTRAYHPEDERHVLRCGIALLLCLILLQFARKVLNDVKLTLVLALCVVVAFLLLFVVPHHALVEHSPKTQVGKALLIVFGRNFLSDRADFP